MESTSYTPSLARHVLMSALMGAFAVIFAPLAFVFGNVWYTYSFLHASFPMLVIGCVAVGLLIFVVMLRRFQVKGVKSVEISDRGVTLMFRDDRRKEMAWGEVTTASLTYENALFWTFLGAHSALSFCKDGFSSREWKQLSRDIAGELRPRGIQIKSDKLGARWLK